MKHVLFSDVDGTIIGRDDVMSDSTPKALQQFQKKGGIFAICTGNGSFSKMQDLSKELGADYLITSNGALIQDGKTLEVIKSQVISKDIVNKIWKFAKEHKIIGACWGKNGLYQTPKVNDFLLSHYEQAMFKNDIKKYGAHTKLIPEDVHKLEFYDEVEKIDLIYIELKALGLEISRMKPTHVEITAKNVSKGQALKFLAKKLDFNVEETMTIGDSANDFSMLSITPYSYAMANSRPGVDEVAKLKTSAYDQHGLAEAIQDYLYRTRDI